MGGIVAPIPAAAHATARTLPGTSDHSSYRYGWRRWWPVHAAVINPRPGGAVFRQLRDFTAAVARRIEKTKEGNRPARHDRKFDVCPVLIAGVIDNRPALENGFSGFESQSV